VMSSEPLGSWVEGVGEEEFRRACGRFATGVAVATVFDAAGDPHGITVNSFSSVSLEPPLVLLCIGHSASIRSHFRAPRRFGLNVLREDQETLSQHFARKGRDGFEEVPCVTGETGVPLIPGVLATLQCEIVSTTPAGDHDIVVAALLRGDVSEGRPLLYFGGQYRRIR